HDDDDPAGDLGVVGVPAEPEHQGGDEGQAERGQHRAEQGPGPAQQGHPAQDDGGPAGQGGGGPDRGPGRAPAGERGGDQPGQPGEEPAHDVGDDPGPADVEAGQEGGRAVAAHGVGADPEAAAFDRQPPPQQDPGQPQDRLPGLVEPADQQLL